MPLARIFSLARRALSCALLAAGLFLGGAQAQSLPFPGTPVQQTADWTLMVYLCGDNDIETGAILELTQMEQAIPPGVEIVVLFDRSAGYSKAAGDWSGARLMRVRRAPPLDVRDAVERHATDSLPAQFSSEVLEDWGKVDMSDPAVLQRFIERAAAQFPARRYALIPWNHGGGWRAMLVDDDAGDGRPGRGTMSVREFITAARTAAQRTLPRQRFDLILYDMCLMGELDVLAETQTAADYAVASPPVEPGQGTSYLTVLPLFRADISTRDLAAQVADRNIEFFNRLKRPSSFSAYDLSQMGAFTARFRELAAALTLHAPTAYAPLTRAINFSTHHEDYFEDLKSGKNSFSSIEFFDWLDRIERAVPGLRPGLIAEVRALAERLAYHRRTTDNLPQGRGLTIYAPLRRSLRNDKYNMSRFARESGMGQFFEALYNAQELQGGANPTITGMRVGDIRLDRAANRYVFSEIAAITPFARNTLEFTVTGTGILWTRLMQYQMRGSERIIHYYQLLTDERSRQAADSTSSVHAQVLPTYSDTATHMMREVGAQIYKVNNGYQSAPVTVENLQVSRDLYKNVSECFGLYADPEDGGRESFVKVSFSNRVRSVAKVIVYTQDARGNVNGMREIRFKQGGRFRPALTIVGSDGRERREFGDPIEIKEYGLLLTVGLAERGKLVGYIAQTETFAGRSAMCATPPKPVWHDPTMVRMIQSTLRDWTTNILGRYGVVQFTPPSTQGVDALPLFQTLEFQMRGKDVRWTLRDGGSVSGEGLTLTDFSELPQLELHKDPEDSYAPMGETVESWFAFLSGAGTGPGRSWFLIGMLDGTRMALYPIEDYPKNLRGVWSSGTERWQFDRDGTVRLMRDGRTVTGSYSVDGSVIRMSGMPADEYAFHLDRRQERLLLMSRDKRLSVLSGKPPADETAPAAASPSPAAAPATAPAPAAAPAGDPRALIGRWASPDGPERNAVLIGRAGQFSTYTILITAEGKTQAGLFRATDVPGRLQATFHDGTMAKLTWRLSGRSLAIGFENGRTLQLVKSEQERNPK
jgi:hypothetical protein